MATNLVFNNVSTQVPGAYSMVDPSGLASVGLGATGIVALIGQAQGGKPYTAVNGPADFIRLSSPAAAAQYFTSGDLLEACSMAFAPSSDANISGGAQQIVALKVNPSTPSSAVFGNAHGAVMQVTSLDYGAATSQINVTIAPGSSYGQLLTIAYQNIIETADNLGGPLNFKLQYVTGADDPKLVSWQTMTAGVEADGSIHANGALGVAGLATDVTASTGTPATAQIQSTTADAGQVLALYGLDASGNALRENITLSASGGSVDSANQYASIQGAALLYAGAYGTISVSLRGNQALSFAQNQRGRGAVVFTNAFVANGPVTLSNPSDTAVTAVLDGLDAQGAPLAQVLAVPAGGQATTALPISHMTALAVGGVSAAAQLTLSAQAARYDSGLGATLPQAAAYFNSLTTPGQARTYGFVATADYTVAKVLLSSLDATAADVSILSPVQLTSGLNAVVNWINTNSQLVSATVLTGAQGAPDNTSRPTYLGGGSEGVATFADYQNCLNLLKQLYINSVVCLTSDPAVSAAVDAHCTFMCGRGKKERDGFVGLMNAAQTDVPTISEALAQAEVINSRNIRAIPQAVTRYSTQGVLTEFPPHFAAVLAAGMQAGATVGTSLTHKYASVVTFRHHPSLDPINQAEQLIGGGLMYLEHIDGVGSRWVRNITTYLQDNNLAYTEGSVNAAANYSVYSIRTALEDVIGKPAFTGTTAAVATICTAELQALVRSGVLVSYGPPQVSIAGDTISVSLLVAPIVPTNFVTLTMHLSTQSAVTAAATAA